MRLDKTCSSVIMVMEKRLANGYRTDCRSPSIILDIEGDFRVAIATNLDAAVASARRAAVRFVGEPTIQRTRSFIGHPHAVMLSACHPVGRCRIR